MTTTTEYGILLLSGQLNEPKPKPKPGESKMLNFGVEIECCGNTNDCFAVANNLRLAGIAANAETYNHATSSAWKIVTDSSLMGSNPMEVVSPVLSGQSGLDNLFRVIMALSQMGCTVDACCGFHVHVDVRGYSVKNLANVVKWFVKFEKFFDSLVAKSRRGVANAFCKSLRQRFGGEVVTFQQLDACETLDALRHMFAENHLDRYYNLNLCPFWRQGSIEFRSHQGTLNATKATQWVSLVARFTELAAEGRPRVRNNGTTLTESAELNRFFRQFPALNDLRQYFHMRQNVLRRTAN